ncbi:MAG: efflux RND transporter periplasmic adaptor subunit [Desulfotomaculales bacterium]
MPKTKSWLILAGILLTVAVTAAAAYRGFNRPAVEVKAAPAEERLFEDKVLATGRVESLRQAEVVAPYAARLVYLKVKEGDPVEAGQVLGELDTSDAADGVKEAEAALAVARAELASAGAALEAAQARAEAARKKAERFRYLFEQNAVSQAELEAAEIEYAGAKAEAATAAGNIRALEARVKQAQVALDNARRAVAKGRLTAPLAGVVMEITAKEGSFLQPGGRILTVGDPEELRVVADLSEQDVGGLAAGQKVEVNWAAYPDKAWRGKVARVAPAVVKKGELETERAVRVFIAIEQAGLLPGATVDVVIHRVQPRKAVLVPSEAVVDRGKTKVVFAVEKGVARERAVTVGGANELYTEIRSGLDPGAQVILDPRDIKDGQPVHVTGGAKK